MFSWPSVPPEKGVLLDALRKLCVSNRERLFFYDMAITSALH